ncbi:A disintegrin and metalloproteinase with thrombospondin motifs 5 isoform X2 [Octodon degus]|uniref:A disintegrin and metalloproteinase with thrombospondin motifs 5 n=1 Tax=Octodon degus TaxID=10160 RepID=A0A6P6E3X4_OCTDE|nr:A disintegrin and metalloproteinase with thrombospondin motifs 5 isoform X2 [Octodon degus]
MLLWWASLLLCALRLPQAAAPAQDKAGPPLAAAAAAQPRRPQGEEALSRVEPPGHPHALALQHRARGLVQNVDQLYSGGGKVGYLVYAGGRRFLLDLERDGSVGATGFPPAGGGLSASRRHRGHCFYRGTVDGSPRSLAVFDLCGGLHGFFAVKHARYTIKPLLRGPRAEADTVRVYGEESERIPHVYTREGFSFEALPPRASCETPTLRPGPHERPPVHNSPGRPSALAPQLPDRSAFSPAGDPGPQTWWRRRRRSISRARQVELLLVADASMARMYGRGLQHYLLTLASIANRLYSHASIENHIRLAVVKVTVLGDKDKSLEVSKNAATTLKNFCKWQHQHNQLGDDHDEHYDAAILFTREDLCGHHSCDTLGMADVGTICSPERSCAVIEDDGLHAAFTVAHEIGNCLLDLPRKQILGPEELPGQTYDATQQCNLTFGPEYSVCPGMDVCARLWCAVVRQGQMVCLTKKLPAVEGTPCGKGRICLQGKCVDKTKKKYYSTSSHGNWGPWGPWGQCSRSCGGGVQFAYRHCNNPAPRNSGRYCTGKRAIYRSCNVAPCPPNGKSFRHEQCEAKNGYQSDAKGVKTFVEWVPKYAGVLPGDVCKLTCRARGTGYYVVFSPKVTDGTECRPYSNSVCVRGRCVRTGCDGIIGSKLQYDKCGVCGGDNSSCTKVIGTFNKKSKGYTDVVRIPEGATHIKVRQFKAKDQTRFTAYLALKKKNGEYLINGKYMISTSETIIDINGTVMNYSGWSHRDDFLHGMGYSATKEILIVQILATDPTKALDVRYSFFVPKKSGPAVNSLTSHGSNKVGLHTSQLQWVTGPWLACSRTCDTGWHTRTVQCQDGNRKLAKGCLLSQRPSAFKQCLLKKC